MLKGLPAIIAIAALGLAGCATMDKRGSDLNEILVGDWRVSQLAFDVVPRNAAPVVTFETDGSLYGSTGCNRFNSNYSIAGNSLRVSPIAVTRRACEPSLREQETRFLEVMQNSTEIAIADDGRLHLRGSGDLRLNAERITDR